MQTKYTMGVLGLGEGRSVLSAVQSSEYWNLGNVCDVNEALCRARQQEFGLRRYTTAYEDLLQDPEIDTIAIYTPDQLHATHIRQALKAGKDVICTKPLLLSLDDAAELLTVQEQTGGTVFVGQSSRFFEPMLHQRRDFENGRFGDLVTMETHYVTDARWFLQKEWSRKRGFSWMYNFMVHAVDLARWYFPHIAEVYGIGTESANSKAYGLDCSDTLKFLLKDENGRPIFVQGSYATPTLAPQTEPSIKALLRGTAGISMAEYPSLQYHTHFEDTGYVEQIFEDKRDYYFRFESNHHHAGEYQNYIDYFARCKNDGQTPLPDLREGIGTIAILVAMERSMACGAPVRIADILREYGLPARL